MALYDKLLNNHEYLKIAEKIGSTKFITNGKWDWEHGLGHYRRVASYVNKILSQLNADERTIELGIIAAFLHDIGLIKGNKADHAKESSKLFFKYINKNDISKNEYETLKQAIADHSSGDDIKSLIGLALVLADKLDVTYHRTENSSIQDKTNKEIQKIRSVSIRISKNKLTINYTTYDDFDINVFKEWPKAITIPHKVSNHLNKKLSFSVNHKQIDISNFLK